MRLWIVVLLAVLRSLAQDAAGSISGTVTDESGAVIAHARIVVASAPARTTSSDDSGRFMLADLAPGVYTLELHSPGFTDRELSVTVQSGKKTEIAASLAVGAIGDCRGPDPAPPPKVQLERLVDRQKTRITGMVAGCGSTNALVSLWRDGEFGHATSVMADTAGAYQIDGVSPGLYQFLFRANQCGPVLVEKVKVEKGHETKIGPVQLQMATMICL